jgi:dTDP-4-dehydrorhamnose reductase
MINIFILGSTGYIGARLLNYVKLKKDSLVFAAGRANFDVFVDLEGKVNDLVNAAKKDDIVVFFSSVSSPDICSNHPELAYKINVTATVSLINKLAEKGVKVIFSSTDVVFGKCGNVATDNSQLMPFGYYGEMKAKVENDVLDNNLVKVVRFSYVLGNGDKYTNMLKKMAAGKQELEVFEGFERNVVFVDDVIEGIYKLIIKWDSIKSSCINFVGPNLTSRFRITQLFAEQIYPTLKYKLVDAPVGFWNSRPKIIETTSEVFPIVLGRAPLSVELIVKNWSK